MKKITSLLLIAVMAISSIYVGSITSNATSKPKAPTSLVYDCPEAIDGANLLFKKPSGTISGYNIVVKDYKGKTKYNKTFKSSLFSKITLRGAQYEGYYWYSNDGINKVVKAGQWYTIKMRAYKTSEKKKVYSSWSKATYGACDVTGMKAKRSGKKVKISWNKMRGVSNKNSEYLLTIKSKHYWISRNNSVTVSSIKKSEKLISVFIVCYKKVDGKLIRSDSTSSYHNEEIK